MKMPALTPSLRGVVRQRGGPHHAGGPRARGVAARRPRAPEDVVHAGHEHVLSRRDGYERRAQRHTRRHQAVRLVDDVVDHPRQPARVAARRQAYALQARRRLRVVGRHDRLQHDAPALHEARAQHLMAPRQERERALQRRRADLAAQAAGVAHVVGRAVRLHLVQHQHLLLVGGAGHARRALLGAEARARDGRLRGPRADAPQRQRQAGDGGRAE